MTVRLITKHIKRFPLENIVTYESFASLIQDSDLNKSDIVIINTYDEDNYEAGILLGQLRQENHISSIHYLSDDRDLNISSIIIESGGTVDTEDYLTDPDSFDVFLESVGENEQISDPNITLAGSDLSKQGSVSIIQSFYRDVSLGRLDLSNKSYLNTVKKAVEDLNTNVTDINHFLKAVSHTINDLYNNAYINLDELSNELMSLQTDYGKLQEKFERLQGVREAESSNSIQNFSSYKVNNNYGARFIVFKEYSSVRYLTSFILGYKNHLESKLSKRVRVIFIIPNKVNWLDKYANPASNMAHYSIENETFKNEVSTTNKVGYCEKPINKLYQYFSDLSDDYIIVVDRTSDSKPAVIGNVETWHCFSGKSESDIYPGTSDKRIFTMKGTSASDIVIPHINSYPLLASERGRIYDSTTQIEELYKRMDESMSITRN